MCRYSGCNLQIDSKMFKSCLLVAMFVGFISVSEGFGFGEIGGFRAFGGWTHRLLFGNGKSNRRHDGGISRPTFDDQLENEVGTG